MSKDDDFNTQLEAWFDSIKNTLTMTAQQKAKITGAGAKVFADILRDETPYNPHIKTDEHLRDCIMFKAGKTLDNLQTGDTDVGFSKNKAYIARFLNDGTKKMAATHFRDNAVEKATEPVKRAEALAFKEMLEEGLK